MEISRQEKVWRYVLFVTVVAAVIYFLFLVREILLPFFLGALLAYLLFRPVRWMERKGLRRAWAILLLYLTALVILALALYFAIPAMVRELSQLAALYPEYSRQWQDLAARYDQIDIPAKLSQTIDQNLIKIEKAIYSGLSGFLGGLLNLMSKVLALVFSPILAFYIMNDWEKIRDSFLALLSPGARREVDVIGKQIDDAWLEFIKGHLTIAALVGTLTGLSALVLGVKFPLLIGISMGISDLIPYFGPFLGAIPAIAVSFSESWRLGLYMTAAIIIIQQLESNVVAPRIMGEKLGLHPLVIVFSLLAGGKLLGIWGMLFALPIVVALKVILSRTYLLLMNKE